MCVCVRRISDPSSISLSTTQTTSRRHALASTPCAPTVTPGKPCDWPSQSSTRCGSSSRDRWTSTNTKRKVKKTHRAVCFLELYHPSTSLISPFSSSVRASPEGCDLHHQPGRLGGSSLRSDWLSVHHTH